MTVISPNVNHKKLIFTQCIWRNLFRSFQFSQTSISAARFLVVFDHFQICKICRYFYTKLKKLYNPPRNPRVGSKSPKLFVKKPICTGDLSPTCKIFIERPALLFEQILHLFVFLLLTQVNTHSQWLLLSISVALVIFICKCSRSSYQIIQKQVLVVKERAKLVVVVKERANNLIDMI